MAPNPPASRMTGLGLGVAAVELVYVTRGVEVPAVYVYTFPPARGRPELSKNCKRGIGRGPAGVCARVTTHAHASRDGAARPRTRFINCDWEKEEGKTGGERLNYRTTELLNKYVFRGRPRVFRLRQKRPEELRVLRIVATRGARLRGEPFKDFGRVARLL